LHPEFDSSFSLPKIQKQKSFLSKITKYYHPNAQIRLQQEQPTALAFQKSVPTPKQPRNRANTFTAPPSAHSLENPSIQLPSRQTNVYRTPTRPKQNIDTSDVPSESSISEDDTVNQLPRFNSILPPLPSPQTFPLRPAVFDPDTPAHPSTSDKKTDLPSVPPPLIPKPQFVPHTEPSQKPAPAQPKPSIAQTSVSHLTQKPHSTKTPSIMSSVKGVSAMPGPGSSKAPSFSGKTSELLEFLELFEDLASSCSVMHKLG
jgi:hypothetical protein